MRDQLVSIKLQLDVLNRSHDETANLAEKVLELSQALRQTWLTADYATKRCILEIVFLNYRLVGVTLVPTIRKPFDVLIEGLHVSSSRGDCPLFEPLIAAVLDVTWSSNAEVDAAKQVLRITA